MKLDIINLSLLSILLSGMSMLAGCDFSRVASQSDTGITSVVDIAGQPDIEYFPYPMPVEP